MCKITQKIGLSCLLFFFYWVGTIHCCHILKNLDSQQEKLLIKWNQLQVNQTQAQLMGLQWHCLKGDNMVKNKKKYGLFVGEENPLKFVSYIYLVKAALSWPPVVQCPHVHGPTPTYILGKKLHWVHSCVVVWLLKIIFIFFFDECGKHYFDQRCTHSLEINLPTRTSSTLDKSLGCEEIDIN